MARKKINLSSEHEHRTKKSSASEDIRVTAQAIAPQEPMIQFQTEGHAAVLNYNVPEPTSYSGRNFIDLLLPGKPSDFFIGINPTSTVRLKKSSNLNRDLQDSDRRKTDDIVETKDIVEAMKNGFYDKRFFINNPSITGGLYLKKKSDSEGFEIVSSRPISSLLDQLDPFEVANAIKAGKKLALYVDMSGTLTYQYLDHIDVEDEGSNSVSRINRMLPSDGGGGTRPPIISISISDPKTDASIQLPKGIKLEVRGGLIDDDVVVKKIVVLIKTMPSGAVHSEGTATIDPNHDTWSYTQLVPPGTYDISATAFAGTTTRAAAVKNIKVSEKPPVDNQPPTVAITSPSSNTPYVGSTGMGVGITLSGTAWDDIQVRDVKVKVGADDFITAIDRSGSWSLWEFSTTIKTPGIIKIIAEATDTAGKKSPPVDISLKVDLVTPDTIDPTISISSPPDRTLLRGLPYEGVMVEVRGTASDNVKVEAVKIKIGNNEEGLARPISGGGDFTQGWVYNDMVTTEGTHRITATAVDTSKRTKTTSIDISVYFIEVTQRGPHLMLVEDYKMSSYLGNYGAGRTIKTLTLLPGEKTKISVKTFTSKEEKQVKTSCILDSVTSQTVESFEAGITKEQSDKEGYNMTKSFEIEGRAAANWGWGQAEIKAGYREGTNTNREEFAKNISNNIQKNVMEASSKRDLKVETSYEVKEERREETFFEQEVENINVSRALNFVFRQMNQEFLTFLHLTDIRVLYLNVTSKEPKEWISREVSLSELDSLLKQVIIPAKINAVKEYIIDQVESIKDYKSNLSVTVPNTEPTPNPKNFIQKVQIKSKIPPSTALIEYYRVNRDFVSEYIDPTLPPGTDGKLKIPGMIIAFNRYVLRTEAIIVDSLLGQGEALDEYSKSLQTQSITERIYKNTLMAQEIAKYKKAIEILTAKDKEAAALYAQMFPCCPEKNTE